MILRFISIFAFVIALASCHFTETMVLREDGTGKMAIGMDLTEMMNLGFDDNPEDPMLMDSIISIKNFLEENKDSIATLSKEKQAQLKSLENFSLNIATGPKSETKSVTVFVNFNTVSAANELMQGLSKAEVFAPFSNTKKSDENGPNQDFIGVSYSYSKGVF